MKDEIIELFNCKKESIGMWRCKSEIGLDAEDKAMFSNAKVVSSEYDQSVCFFLKRGGQTYVPISNLKELNVGDNVNLDTLLLQVLEKSHEQDVIRVKVSKF